ncbi:S1C family serine protease [Georgenia faecalis]|uniref:S1C family serine protease n=1 Tax=Georgenia faecalis TaxID=2483799 RepID=A0ABV9D8L3_9MICO|nr:trypsin-like peptidase domain-containing protein [Georgenia faecalis]
MTERPDDERWQGTGSPARPWWQAPDTRGAVPDADAPGARPGPGGPGAPSSAGMEYGAAPTPTPEPYHREDTRQTAALFVPPSPGPAGTPSAVGAPPMTAAMPSAPGAASTTAVPAFPGAPPMAPAPGSPPLAWSRPGWPAPDVAPAPVVAPAPLAAAAPRGRRRWTAFALVVLVAFLLGLVTGSVGERLLSAEPETLPPSGSGGGDRAPDSIAGIASTALESTVFIETRTATEGSSGSGMVLREDGYVVTNNHVIASAAEGDGQVLVTFSDGTEASAEIVGRTADYDLAVLRVDREGLTPLVLGDSDAVVVGDPVVAVGAPLGLEGTVTSGIVSALNRPVEAGGAGDSSFINAIQTDAAINPGNSGGPLVNDAGEVIGINTAIAQAAGQTTGNIGLGFAIPSNQVRRTAEQIIDTGTATYPVIGVALDTSYRGEGVQVLTDAAADTPAVTPDGPGAAAGIEPGDVITHIDDLPVTSAPELIVAIRARAPGETVVLTVRRGDDEREVEVVLGESAGD